MRLDLWGAESVGLSGRVDLKGLRGRLGGGRFLRRGGRMKFEFVLRTTELKTRGMLFIGELDWTGPL